MNRPDLGPSVPVHEHVRPQRGILGPEDVRVACSSGELRVIAALLGHERLAGQTPITQRDGSPWLEREVVVGD